MTSNNAAVDAAVAPTAASPLALPDVSPELADRLSAGIDAVNARLREVVDHDDPFIAEAAGHLLAAGGKRFRPMLTLLAAETAGGWNDDVITAAAAVELTHLASLYHDDVMDEADTRRAAPSANVLYGNSTAILVGDLLFGQASWLVSTLGPEAVRIQAETFVRLCAGQIRDDRPCPEGTDPVEYYLGILADKTGVLIATAARYGAMFAGASDQTVRDLEQYGEKLGVAFQLADDILDVDAEAAQSGKTPGTDLREGKRTLPVLHVLASSDPADAHLAALLRSDLAADDEAHAEALALLRGHAAMERARKYTREVAQEAIDLLAPLGDTDAAAALAALATGVVDRHV